MPAERRQSRISPIVAALRAHRGAIAGGVLIACTTVGLYEWLYAAPVRAETAALTDDVARIRARNAEVIRTVSSPEATAAWIAHVEAVDREWNDNLAKIPPAELVEQQYDKLAALTTKSRIKQLSFARLDVAAIPAKIATAPAGAPAGEAATSVSPAIELRRVKITFLATADSLAAFLAEIRRGADERLLSVAEYKVTVANDQPGYSMRVEMVVNVYFKKRDHAAVASASEPK